MGYPPLDNTLINNNKLDQPYNGTKPKIEKFINKFPLKDDPGLTINVEKILILKNGEWAADTYIKSNKTIDKKAIKKYVSQLEKDYEIVDVTYEFHGGPPMGTDMVDYNEIKGDNIWVVNMKPNLYKYLEKKGHVGNVEDLYSQIGGNSVSSLHKLWKYVKLELYYVNNIIVDTINKVFFIEKNKKRELNPILFKPVNQITTHYDGTEYYTYLDVYKDGKFIDRMKVESKNNPIEWRYIMNKILEINEHSKFYGYVYKLSHSLDKGLILETTDDLRYRINYKCN